MPERDTRIFNIPLVTSTTYFSLHHPEGLESLLPQNWLLLFTLEGKAILEMGNSRFETLPGDALCFPPGTLLKCNKDQDWVHRWVAFMPLSDILTWLDWPHIPESSIRILRVKDYEIWNRVTGTLDQMEEVWARLHPLRRDELAWNFLEQALLWLDEMNPQSHPPVKDPRILEAVTFMRRYYAEKIVLADVARTAHLSASRFSRIFRSLTGFPPMQYLESIRIERAKEMLLSSQEPLVVIARNCGFCNEYYFSNVFLRRTGYRPSQFRNMAH
jgi:AraC family transcriptional regulator, arabinose operon regulatory protein